MDRDHHQRQEDVTRRHNGRHESSHLGDTMYAADDDKGGERCQCKARDQRRDRECITQGGGYTVGLHACQKDAAAENGNDGQQYTRPALTQSLFIKSKWTAPETARMRKLINLGQGRFHKSSRCTQKSDHPHPEHRSGTAESNGCSHPHDVSGPHAAGKSQAEGLKRGNAIVALLVAEKRGHHKPQPAHLQKTGTERKVQSRQE